MKFLSVALIQAIVVLITHALYFLAEVVAYGRGWAWMVDVFPMFLAGMLAGILLIFTYTSIGLESLERFNGRFLSGHRLARHRVWDQDLGEHRQEFV